MRQTHYVQTDGTEVIAAFTDEGFYAFVGSNPDERVGVFWERASQGDLSGGLRVEYAWIEPEGVQSVPVPLLVVPRPGRFFRTVELGMVSERVGVGAVEAVLSIVARPLEYSEWLATHAQSRRVDASAA